MDRKRVLVTGGTGTLGQALVAALVEANCAVVAGFECDIARAERFAQSVGCELFQGDTSDEATVIELFTHRYDAVFHLAARSFDAILPRVSTQNWEKTLKNNAQSAFLVTRAALQTLPRGGHLILVSSRVGERGFAGQSAYAANKAALLGLMKTAAIEGREAGICVNAICPGFAPSALSQTLSNQVLARREAENHIPNADAAQSLASLGVYILQTRITGQILRPDGRI